MDEHGTKGWGGGSTAPYIVEELGGDLWIFGIVCLRR